MVWEMVIVEEDNQINPQMVDKMVGAGDRHLHATMVVELGHISLHCDKPPRQGGDMYPLPAQLPNRSNYFGIEVRGEKADPSRLIAK